MLNYNSWIYVYIDISIGLRTNTFLFLLLKNNITLSSFVLTIIYLVFEILKNDNDIDNANNFSMSVFC